MWYQYASMVEKDNAEHESRLVEVKNADACIYEDLKEAGLTIHRVLCGTFANLFQKIDY